MLDRSFSRPLDERVTEEFLQWTATLRPEAVYDLLASQRDLDLTGELAGIRQPGIVVHGRSDRVRPSGCADGRGRDGRSARVGRRHDEQEALRYLRDAGIPVAVGGMPNVKRAFHRMVYGGSHNQVLIQYRDAD